MKRKIRVGILGLGRAGRFMHAPELALSPELFTITAACDHAADRRSDLPPEFAYAEIYARFEQMLADSRVDLITIATRNDDHTPHALQALEAGKYVVVEKPIAVNQKQIDDLERAARQYPGKLFFRFNRRFEPAFGQVREIIASGILGQVGMVKLYRHTGYVRRCDWQTLSQFHGGLLNNWGPHLVDQGLQLLNSRVIDLWSNLQHNVAAGDADDQVKLLLHGENGRVVDIEITSTVTLPGRLYEVWGNRGTLWVTPDEKTIHLRYLDPEQQLSPIEAVADNFPLIYGNPQDELRFIDEERPVDFSNRHILRRGQVIDPGADSGPGYTYPDTMWAYIYADIMDGIPFPVTLEQGLEVMRIINRARHSSGFRPHELNVACNSVSPPNILKNKAAQP